MKKPEAMYSAKSFTNLTVFRSGKKTDDAELVVTCGYTNDGRYGYFICNETTSVDSKTKKPVWLYEDQVAFFPKKNEATYREVLVKVKELTQ